MKFKAGQSVYFIDYYDNIILGIIVQKYDVYYHFLVNSIIKNDPLVSAYEVGSTYSLNECDICILCDPNDIMKEIL